MYLLTRTMVMSCPEDARMSQCEEMLRMKAGPRALGFAERGLAFDPEQRWPSMQALLDTLATGRTRARIVNVDSDFAIVG